MGKEIGIKGVRLLNAGVGIEGESKRKLQGEGICGCFRETIEREKRMSVEARKL